MSTTVPPGEEPPGPPTSKTTYVLERLRREIAQGSLRAGEPLRQGDLAQRFGVSPTPVREALRLLEAEGAVSYSPHRGATVSELTLQRIEDLYLLRASVEGLGARLAAERVDPEGLADMRELHERMMAARDSPDRPQLAAWNRDLHGKICRAGSELVAEHVVTLWRMIPTNVTMWAELAIADEFTAQHSQILAAIEAHDPERASALMEEHVRTAAAHRKQWAASG